MSMKNSRPSIPDELSTEILYLSDHTCCICNDRGSHVQIHHIDEKSANNVLENLAVLCVNCHEKAHIKGGFSRKLNSKIIIKYSNEWIKRVKRRRDQIDKVVKQPGSKIKIEERDYANEESHEEYMRHFELNFDVEKKQLQDYALKILEFKKTINKFAKLKWESGVTATMNGGSYEIIDFCQEILVELSSYYPFGHFGKDPKKYFNEIISARFMWHRQLHETYGLGKGGTIISTIVASCVLEDADKMVSDMIWVLFDKYSITYKDWRLKWSKIQ